MLRLYARPEDMPQGARHLHLLFPFWGMQLKPHEDARLFQAYLDAAQGIFTLVDDLTQADGALLPASWTRYVMNGQEALGHALAQRAAAAGVPLFVFTPTDEELTLPFEAWHFRPSLKASRRGALEFALPGWTRDIAQGQDIVWRRKGERPVVGFCGNAAWTWRHELRLLQRQIARWRGRVPALHQPPERWTTRLRLRLLRQLAQSPLIADHFILREAQYGGAQAEPRSRQRLQDEYDANMRDSDYVLCIRGHGNFSFRFYETLSAGRIPVFINTDCVLPYDFVVNWREVCVWVEAHEIPHAAEKIADFHSRLSPADFKALQHEARRRWEQWGSPLGFFREFHRHLAHIQKASGSVSACCG